MRYHLRYSLVLLALLALGSGSALAQGAKPAPKTAKPPAKTAPAPKKPAAPGPVAAAPPPAPAPAPPSDVRFKSTYTNAEQVTESSTYVQGTRERYELGDTILLKQHDQKRVVQISRVSNTYLITPEGAATAPEIASPKPPGVVNVSVSIVDLGDRKQMFGTEARHVRTLIDRQPQPGACDSAKLRIDTEGWYIDMPKAMTTAPAEAPLVGRAGCADDIKATESGDAALLGFPIGYRTTFTDPDDKDAKSIVVSMDVTEFEITRLDASLFDIPAGMTEAASAQQLAKAVSDANEVKLAEGTDTVDLKEKKPGAVRVGVPEVINKTTETVDTRALRARLVAELEEQKIDAVPMASTSVDARAKDLNVDYLLIAEVTDLKSSKPGGITKLMKNTAGEGGKEITEAKLNIQLLPPGGKPRLAKSSSGKDGGIGLKTGLGLAKFAGSLYLKVYMGGVYSSMGSLSSLQMMKLGGMGSPALIQLQSGLGATRFGGSGMDRTAGAAMFVMQQAMNGGAAGASGSTSYDAALVDAIQDAGKDVADSLKKATLAKK
jgi:hypothetical protein